MKIILRYIFLHTITLASFTFFSGDLSAASSITSIGGVQQFTDSFNMNVSSDGSTVVYRSVNGQPYQWTAQGGSMFVGDLPGGGLSGSANAASGDGSVVVGNADSGDPNNQAFLKDSNGIIGLGYLGAPTNLQSTAHDISSDAAVIVGVSRLLTGGLAGFQYTTTNGLEHLTGLQVAYAVSANGGTIVGRNNANQAARLTGFGTIGEQYLPLGILPGRANSTATAISADGSTIAGDSQGEGFYWTAGSGIQSLGSGVQTDSVSDITADGSIIIGQSGPSAFIWDSTNGIRNLQTVLTNDYDLDLTGWTLLNATGISDDGSIIVGVGLGPGGFTREGWIIDLDIILTEEQDIPLVPIWALAFLTILFAWAVTESSRLTNHPKKNH